MRIGVVVHAVDTASHETIPAGFRWAVHLGDHWHDMATCLNAGWEPTEVEAAMAGEAAAVVGVRIARLLSAGTEVDTTTTVLDFDPVPADADTLTIGA